MSDDYMNVSDEDFLNMAPPEEVEIDANATDQEEKEEVDTDVVEEEDLDLSEEEETAVDDTESNVSTDDAKEENDETEEEVSENESEAEEVAEPETKEEAVDYEKQVQQILAPFKANGKEMQVDSIEDAMTLMQQGANYNKKMTSLKPGLKVLKMLENNELLDEGKLSYLIDLHNQDPKAIQKLIKDSKVNPLDIEEGEEIDYVPQSHAVSDSSIELDSVIEDLKQSNEGSLILNTVSNDWDESSRKEVVAKPAYLKDLAEHVKSGVYAKVTAVIERERALGRLTNLSDFQAYNHVGEAMHEAGHLDAEIGAKTVAPIAAAVVKKKPNDPKLKDRKRAASGTKSSASKKGSSEDIDYLKMSDEDFAKISNSPYQ